MSIKAEYLVEDQSSLYWDNRPDTPIFAIFFTNEQKWAKVFPELLHQTSPYLYTQYSHI